MASPASSPPGDGARPIDELFSLAYTELRRLAARIRRDDHRATMTPTALVNEAWVKLASGGTVVPACALHFKRLAARAMRQVLVDSARRRRAAKRGGALVDMTISDDRLGLVIPLDDLIAVDDALTRLGANDERLARVVELRFFAGLTEDEIAEALGVTSRTVQRDWAKARAWLHSELSGDQS